MVCRRICVYNYISFTITFRLQLHLVYNYISFTITFRLQLHFVYNYISFTITFRLQLHFVCRRICASAPNHRVCPQSPCGDGIGFPPQTPIRLLCRRWGPIVHQSVSEVSLMDLNLRDFILQKKNYMKNFNIKNKDNKLHPFLPVSVELKIKNRSPVALKLPLFFFFFFFLRDFIFKKTLFEKLQYLKQGNYIVFKLYCIQIILYHRYDSLNYVRFGLLFFICVKIRC